MQSRPNAALLEMRDVLLKSISLCLPLSALIVPRSDFSPTDSHFFREMKHSVPQQPIRFGLIAATVLFEPSNDVGIQTHSYGFLRWAIEPADFGSTPIENRGNVREINVRVSFCGDGADVSFLLLCELPHRLSFHATRQHEPK